MTGQKKISGKWFDPIFKPLYNVEKIEFVLFVFRLSLHKIKQ